MYVFIKTAIHARTTHKAADFELVERYVADNFYCFSRNDILIALTNTDSTVTYPVSYNPYTEGQTVCNIFYPTDCVKVTNKTVNVTLVGGETKIFIPKGSSFFKEFYGE